MLAYALFLWWASTGAILFLNHLPATSFRWSMAGFTLLSAGAVAVLAASADDATVRGAYVGFTCGVLLWGWHEMSFFMGFVTGPRRSAGPLATGWRHFWQACETCLYHEAAIALTAVLVAALTIGRPNQVGAWTFFALWAMRLSAKLNVFLGVRNLNEQFVPPRLSYVKAYLTRRRMNALLPFSIIGGTIAAVPFGIVATQPDTSAFESIGHGFVAVLLLLAVIEHAFMVIPLPFAALWNWSVQSRRSRLAPDNSVVARAFASAPPRPLERR
jgi:putative photosynthetic complex assembly protein 2